MVFDPYTSVPGLAEFLGQRAIDEVADDISYLLAAAERAEIEYAISVSGAEGAATSPLVGRFPVSALGQRFVAPELRGKRFRIEAGIAKDTVPSGWGPAGLISPYVWDDVDAGDLGVVLNSAFRVIWDMDITTNFLGLNLFQAELRRAGVSGERHARRRLDAVGDVLAGEYERRAITAASLRHHEEAVSFAAAMLSCAGVLRWSVMGLGMTAKYSLSPLDQVPVTLPHQVRDLIASLRPSDLSRQEAAITQCAGRLVEEGRAAWAERQFRMLDLAGFPFRAPVPDPIRIDGYGTAIYREGLKLVERAASNTSRWVFLSPLLMDEVVLGGWSALISLAPTHLLSQLTDEALARPEETVRRVAGWTDSEQPWVARLVAESESTAFRVAEVLVRAFGTDS